MDPPMYTDSDQETESCTARSRDSGRGSYSTLRTNTPEKGSKDMYVNNSNKNLQIDRKMHSGTMIKIQKYS